MSSFFVGPIIDYLAVRDLAEFPRTGTVPDIPDLGATLVIDVPRYGRLTYAVKRWWRAGGEGPTFHDRTTPGAVEVRWWTLQGGCAADWSMEPLKPGETFPGTVIDVRTGNATGGAS